MANLANYSGAVQRAAGLSSLGWMVAVSALAAMLYFVYEYQGRQNERLKGHIAALDRQIEVLRGRFNEDESLRAGFESNMSLRAEKCETHLQNLESRLHLLENPPPKKKKQRRGK